MEAETRGRKKFWEGKAFPSGIRKGQTIYSEQDFRDFLIEKARELRRDPAYAPVWDKVLRAELMKTFAVKDPKTIREYVNKELLGQIEEKRKESEAKALEHGRITKESKLSFTPYTSLPIVMQYRKDVYPVKKLRSQPQIISTQQRFYDFSSRKHGEQRDPFLWRWDDLKDFVSSPSVGDISSNLLSWIVDDNKIPPKELEMYSGWMEKREDKIDNWKSCMLLKAPSGMGKMSPSTQFSTSSKVRRILNWIIAKSGTFPKLTQEQLGEIQTLVSNSRTVYPKVKKTSITRGASAESAYSFDQVRSMLARIPEIVVMERSGVGKNFRMTQRKINYPEQVELDFLLRFMYSGGARMGVREP